MIIKITNIYRYSITITSLILIIIGICNGNTENEGFCSIDVDSEGSCSLPSKKKIDINSIINTIKEKIKPEKLQRQIAWEKEFIPENSGSLAITSENSTLLTKGTWLVQFYSPWCPFSRSFQKKWQKTIEEIKIENQRLLLENIKIQELIDKMDKNNNEKNNNESNNVNDNNNNESHTVNDNNNNNNNKLKEKKKIKEKKLEKYYVPKDLKFAMIDSTENTDLAALFEIKGYPTIKMIHNGNVITYMNTTSVDILVNFATKEWTKQEWYNRLPKRHSKWYQHQLILSNYLMYIKYYIYEKILINMHVYSVFIALLFAYSFNIVGKIRYGIKKFTNYIQTIIPEMLEIE